MTRSRKLFNKENSIEEVEAESKGEWARSGEWEKQVFRAFPSLMTLQISFHFLFISNKLGKYLFFILKKWQNQFFT